MSRILAHDDIGSRWRALNRRLRGFLRDLARGQGRPPPRRTSIHASLLRFAILPPKACTHIGDAPRRAASRGLDARPIARRQTSVLAYALWRARARPRRFRFLQTASESFNFFPPRFPKNSISFQKSQFLSRNRDLSRAYGRMKRKKTLAAPFVRRRPAEWRSSASPASLRPCRPRSSAPRRANCR